MRVVIKKLNFWFLILVAMLLFLSGSAQTPTEHPKIIFDTDMGPDYDDIGAIAILHALAAKGECEILATVGSDAHPAVAPTIALFNRYYGRNDIPVGRAVETAPAFLSENKWNEWLLQRFGVGLQEQPYPTALSVYRQVLAAQPDSSVTIVTVGFMSNLNALLHSCPDQYSDKDGISLVRAKVKKWVAMAGAFPSGREFNVFHDSIASHEVFSSWPTPILFSGVEIGSHIYTGAAIAKDAALDNPMAQGYAYNLKTYLKEPQQNRQSWDQTAVLCAIRSPEDYFYVNGPGEFVIKSDGSNSWNPNSKKKHYFLTHKYPYPHVAAILEELMGNIK